jgi:hypothetical protein
MEHHKKYKNLMITRKEFESALLNLGYKTSISEKYFVFELKKFDSKVLISRAYQDNDFVDLIHLLSTAVILEGKGVLNHHDDLVKIIEQMRHESLSSVA